MSSQSIKDMHVRVITDQGVLADEGGVSAVSLPGADGELGILPGHRPMVTAVGSGKLILEKGTQREEFSIHGGTASVKPDEIVIFTAAGKDPDITD